ncbi:unnamed protein product [Mycena citricolor]|uniref:Integrase catalytic domain-containing protein n=1 Tax=Mycena citricolor TaxID=2018698 RepID=A0AAD2JZE6_9AGAR|nr:unnamed protein product [Mycena citricolor]
MVQGMEINEKTPPADFCKTCVKTKTHAALFPPKSDTEYKNIGDMTFTDIWGPSRITGIDGSCYYVSFMDAKSCQSIVYFLKAKTDVKDKIRHYAEFLHTQTGKRVKCFQCDNGKEYVNSKVRQYLNDNRIWLELTAPHSSAQNGVAERLNHTLIKNAGAMIAHFNLPKFFRPEAIAYATYLKNQSPTCGLQGLITPDKAFWKQNPDISHLQEFGSPCWVLDQEGKIRKLDKKSQKFIFTGFQMSPRPITTIKRTHARF